MGFRHRLRNLSRVFGGAKWVSGHSKTLNEFFDSNQIGNRKGFPRKKSVSDFVTIRNPFYSFENPRRVSESISETHIGFRTLENLFGSVSQKTDIFQSVS
jgi:hypothetical protein